MSEFPTSEPNAQDPALGHSPNSSGQFHLVKGAIGALAGGVVGVLLFRFALQQGFYVLALPGALIGMACGYASGRKSRVLAVFCGILAATVGIFLQWNHFYQGSLTEFLAQIHMIGTVPLAMLAIGTLFGAWFGFGR